MQQYGVLVVDDSAFVRRAVSKLLESDPQFLVVGVARNGVEALEKIQRFQPDVVTLDIEMPEMNGLEALKKIMVANPVPVVMLSVHTGEGAETTLESLQMGAVDFFLKNALLKDPLEKDIIQDFLFRVKAAASTKIPNQRPKETSEFETMSIDKGLESQVDLVIIGCSTGGPSALQVILPRFPSTFPVPIIVVQHMPPGFTKSLADRFNTMCNLKVKEAQDGDVLESGNIYIAPAGFQTLVEQQKNGIKRIKIQPDSPISTLYKPSVDVTLSSAAPIYQERLLAVILTGMGADGLEGCKTVKHYRGNIIVEAEESCIVYGMPRVVFEAGYADRQTSLSTMYQQIMSFL